MKKRNGTAFGLSLIFIAVFAAATATSAYGAPAYEVGTIFKDVTGKEWVLSEIRSADKTTTINRVKYISENMGDFFTVSFQEDRVAGVGAPNRYFGPYTEGSNRSLTIGNMATTMMMAFREPDELKESEYLAYLSKVTRWDVRDGKLELYTSNSNGTAVTLVFAPK